MVKFFFSIISLNIKFFGKIRVIFLNVLVIGYLFLYLVLIFRVLFGFLWVDVIRSLYGMLKFL